ncbi:isochorismate synthase MenF [Sporosarcina sp. Te-1]|uniref:isochorismate synthase n=1 Tax=Sporosarcina sp. Te-1 TaxID=2818390 RepID=UPI001A9EC705|nr:isochorismate synthase [Sporosarcina sp. Te-1]QTD42669.1 isochorismate synthase [Sporosarcina sp. Te-1]
MIRNLIDGDQRQLASASNKMHFFTETIEIRGITPLSFFESGSADYKNKRFYWQNADRSMTLVGLGHAHIITSQDSSGRYREVSNEWKRLCSILVKEEKDRNPVLFGGFSYDPLHEKETVWSSHPSAFFVVPTFQLVIQDGVTSLSINMITDQEHAVSAFDQLREERDRLIHISQVHDFHLGEKPEIVSTVERDKERYLKAVSQVTKQIREGKAEKVVIARMMELGLREEVSATAVLHSITNEQQESYHFGLENQGTLFFGATPERLIEIKNGQAYSACVAGSIRRGDTAVEDRLLGDELMRDRKNREEHQYVVDMISTVFHRLSHEVSIPKTPRLMKIRDIQHLFTPVQGTVSSDTDIFGFIESLHPTPALGGVPTNVALEMIREEEGMDRGYYAAPIGWTDAGGNGEFAVAIRSALLSGNRAYLYAGGGIVADSDPNSEYAETWVKFRPVLRALGGNLNG